MDWRGVYHHLRDKGPRATVRYARARAAEILWESFDSHFDRRHNVDTAGAAGLSEFEVASENAETATWYEPAPPSVVRQLLEELKIRYEDYLFIDCGSGKGRALLLAAEYPFSKIIGVEFSQALHAAAEQNIRTYRNPRQRCTRIESVCEDAVHYRWPEEPAVIFFFSPFRPTLLEKVLDGLFESLRRRPRSTYIVYYSGIAECIQMLRQTGLECREVKVRRSLADRSPKARVALILRNSANPPDRPSR